MPTFSSSQKLTASSLTWPPGPPGEQVKPFWNKGLNHSLTSVLGWGLCEQEFSTTAQVAYAGWAGFFLHSFYIILQLAAGCFDHYFIKQQEKLCPGV